MESSRTKVIFATLAVAVITILWLATVVHMAYMYIKAANEIGGVMERAQTAGDVHLMKKYLIELKENLEKWGYTHGYYAVVFKNDYTDAGKDYEVICSLIKRLDTLEDLPKNSTEYQVALDDVRGILRELELNPWLWYYYNRFPTALGYFIVWIWSWLGGILSIIGWLKVSWWW